VCGWRLLSAGKMCRPLGPGACRLCHESDQWRRGWGHSESSERAGRGAGRASGDEGICAESTCRRSGYGL